MKFSTIFHMFCGQVICELLVILTPLVIVKDLYPHLADGDGKQQVHVGQLFLEWHLTL